MTSKHYHKERFMSVKMDTKIIDVIFRLGNILSITPRSVRSKKKLTYFQRFWGLLIFILLLTTVNFNFFYIKLHNSNPSVTQYILLMLMVTTFIMHDFHILIIVKLHKQAQWFQLVKYLENTQCHKENFRLYYLQFLTSQLIAIIMTLVGLCLYFTLMGVVNMIGLLFICIEVYFQFFYLILRCIILEMLLSRYQYQKLALMKARPEKVLIQYFIKVLVETKNNLFILKEAADLFNDIFGWTTLVNIFSNCLRTLILLDIFIRNDGPFHTSTNTGTTFCTLYQIMMLLKAWV
jgi:uncharacterized membrane protein YesL